MPNPLYLFIIFYMGEFQRKNYRFTDFGRAECSEICPVPGVLEDISLSGCKIHYDTPVTVSMENDYEIHVRLSRISADPLVLMCHPQWIKEGEDGSTSAGFLFLHSPDTPALEAYIRQLDEEKAASEIDSVLPPEDSCQFV